MNPVSERRSLPSFFAVAASLVLVCGGIVLLTSTAPWTPRPATEPPTPNSRYDMAEADIEVPWAMSQPDQAPAAATEPAAE